MTSSAAGVGLLAAAETVAEKVAEEGAEEGTDPAVAAMA
jgi:hypothetical protein